MAGVETAETTALASAAMAFETVGVMLIGMEPRPLMIWARRVARLSALTVKGTFTAAIWAGLPPATERPPPATCAPPNAFIWPAPETALSAAAEKAFIDEVALSAPPAN